MGDDDYHIVSRPLNLGSTLPTKSSFEASFDLRVSSVAEISFPGLLSDYGHTISSPSSRFRQAHG